MKVQISETIMLNEFNGKIQFFEFSENLTI